MATRTALSSYEMYWYPWDDTKQDCWVREMPKKRVCHQSGEKIRFLHINTACIRKTLPNNSAGGIRISHGNGKTVCLLGMRAEESLRRYSGFLNKKYRYRNECWISKQYKDVWCASPLYDWVLSDIWHANYLFDYDYNSLYDLYYKAGLKLSQMRVASPFNDYSKDSLNLYRVIDPEIWVKLVGRVQGVNFGCIYGKTRAMAYRNIVLPEGHTWKSYTLFLLETLPTRLRNNYIKKFEKSIQFWHETGGGLDEAAIQELKKTWLSN